MKFLTIVLALFITTIAMQAQMPKPRYEIIVKRGDVPLGSIVIELFPDVAPKHSRNFDSLVRVGFYDGTAFHRVIPGFMIQGGGIYSKDPDRPMNEWGYSDPSQTRIPAEFSNISHTRGIVSMARLGNDINSGTSQFFICVANASHLNGKYSAFGQVVEGMNIADSIVMSERDGNDAPYEKVEMRVVALESSSVTARQGSVAGNALSIHPNPSRDAMTLGYRTGATALVDIRIYNGRGEEVALLLHERTSAGSHSLPFNVSALPSGTYTIRMKANDEVVTHPLIITR